MSSDSSQLKSDLRARIDRSLRRDTSKEEVCEVLNELHDEYNR